MRRLAVPLAVAAGVAVAVPHAEARITRIEITSTESPTFGGYAWPGVGQYEKLVGKAYGVLPAVPPLKACQKEGGQGHDHHHHHHHHHGHHQHGRHHD
jgi:hypothetical protein